MAFSVVFQIGPVGGKVTPSGAAHKPPITRHRRIPAFGSAVWGKGRRKRMRQAICGTALALMMVLAMAAAQGQGVQGGSATAPPLLGPVTNLPLPRYVTLKTGEGNARRGPGLTHRIDWVFTRAGMPLRLTAEYENWRRVEDQDGVGGWVHFTLLSGVRSVLVVQDMVAFHTRPDPTAEVVLRAEANVIARLLQCLPEWCRLGVEGGKGWVPKTALWGVDPGEIIE